MGSNQGNNNPEMGNSSTVKKCVYCGTTLYADDTICRFCGRDIGNTRKCPYCANIIPANEDPCHFCGHLEPADEETLKAYYKKQTQERFIFEFLGPFIDGILSSFFN